MTDPAPTVTEPATPPADPATPSTPTPPPASEPGETPPWGDDFDPARAWRTITTLRGEVKEYKGKVTEYEDATKTEAEKTAERLEAAEKRAADLERVVLVSKVAREKGIPDDLVEFLTGADEEALTAQADRLASMVPAPPAEPDGSRPKPRLTPGSNPEGEPVFDAATLAAQIRANS